MQARPSKLFDAHRNFSHHGRNNSRLWSFHRVLRMTFGMYMTYLDVNGKCRDPGSNWGPPDLQSDALPTELSRPCSAVAGESRYRICCQHLIFEVSACPCSANPGTPADSTVRCASNQLDIWPIFVDLDSLTQNQATLSISCDPALQTGSVFLSRPPFRCPLLKSRAGPLITTSPT